jgi:hypothetical protein
VRAASLLERVIGSWPHRAGCPKAKTDFGQERPANMRPLSDRFRLIQPTGIRPTRGGEANGSDAISSSLPPISKNNHWGVMTTSEGTIRVITEPVYVSEFLEKVVQAADSDRDALGFFSRSVYADFCRTGQLFVALASGTTGELYAGHLLLTFASPRRTCGRYIRSRRIGAGVLQRHC